jgi:hypothetical protein
VRQYKKSCQLDICLWTHAKLKLTPYVAQKINIISTSGFHSWFGSNMLEMAAPRDCTRKTREIIFDSGMEAAMTASAWIQTQSENDTALSGFTFGSAVQITRLTMHSIWF